MVLDIGTSVCAEGKVRVAFNKGIQLPEGWILDGQGRPTTDPAALYEDPRGTILPLGGPQAYKGFGIGLLLDMFTGGFSGAQCSRPEVTNASGNAVLFIALDIETFAGAEHFLREVSDLTVAVRSCPRAEGVSEILVPGDPERRERARGGLRAFAWTTAPGASYGGGRAVEGIGARWQVTARIAGPGGGIHAQALDHRSGPGARPGRKRVRTGQG